MRWVLRLLLPLLFFWPRFENSIQAYIASIYTHTPWLLDKHQEVCPAHGSPFSPFRIHLADCDPLSLFSIPGLLQLSRSANLIAAPSAHLRLLSTAASTSTSVQKSCEYCCVSVMPHPPRRSAKHPCIPILCRLSIFLPSYFVNAAIHQINSQCTTNSNNFKLKQFFS